MFGNVFISISLHSQLQRFTILAIYRARPNKNMKQERTLSELLKTKPKTGTGTETEAKSEFALNYGHN